MKRILLPVLLMLSAAAALLAADFWEKKKFGEWSQKDVQKIIRDSPWARPVEVRLSGAPMTMSGGRGGGRRGGGGGSGMTDASSGGIGFEDEGVSRRGGRGGGGGESYQAPPSTSVIVRWHSALPIKQAVARSRYGDEAATSPEAAKMLARQETHYVVGVIGLPGQAVRGNPAQFKAKVVLKLKNQQPIQAVDVQGGREGGKVDLFFFFPRTQEGAHVITLEDGEVELVAPLGTVEIKRKFRLKDMVFEGKLEI